MAESSDRSALPWAGLVIFLMGGYAFWAAQPPLRSSRPELEGLPSPPEVARNSVAARLWEDPLVPAQREYESRLTKEIAKPEAPVSAADKAKSPRERVFDNSQSEQRVYLQQQVQAQAKPPVKQPKEEDKDKKEDKKAGEKTSTLILPVFLDAQPYSESTESRIRCRYAVVSALGATGFVPKESDRIRFWVSRLSDTSPEFIVPFEWFVKDPGSVVGISLESDYTEVMVLWIPENRLGEAPLEDLQKIINGIVDTTVVDETTDTATYLFPNHDVHVLGPTGSSLLPKFISGADCLGADGAEWRIYSDRATLSEDTLNRRLKALSVAPDTKTPLERTIGTDYDLAQQLLGELKLRKASPQDRGNHVVLIAEWDTDYARAWEESFQKALPQEVNGNLHMFSYLRGVDGRLPKDSKGDSGAKKEGSKSSDSDESDGPEGNSQIDYIRRIETRIRNLEHWIRAKDGGSIRAIGVVGSDVYDKILFLRALRQKFPAVLFFTSDLDVRLLEKSEIEHTRNLLVVSHFGFQLSDDLQGKILPFRDSYQTSTYHASLRALQNIHGECVNPQLPNPHIYEIASGAAFDLSARSDSPLHPKAERRPDSLSVLKGLLLPHAGALLLIVLLFLFYRPLTGVATRLGRKRVVFGILVVVGYSGLLLALATDASSENGEPFLIQGGISGWPSQLLRFIAIVITGWFLITATEKLTANAGSIESTFGGLKASGPESHPCGIWLASWTVPLETGDHEGTRSMRKLWRSYLNMLTPDARGARCLLLLGLFLGLGIVIFQLDDWPLQPLRGSLSHQVNGWILGIAGFSLAALLARTIDSTRACIRLIQQISDSPIHWEPKDIEAACGKGPVAAVSASELLNIRLIALRTEAVEKLMYPPCIVICILLLAHSRYLDRWSWNLPILAAFGLMLASAVYCGVLLRYWAERARRAALADVQEELVRETSREGGNPDFVKTVIEEIRATGTGAFSPIQENPLVHAILIPFGGAGILELAKGFIPH